jgi:predicted ArsR family transcriptional regulator
MSCIRRLEHDLGRLAVLGDELRRRMYLYVRSHPGPLSREDVARAVGVSRKLAAFHLDKLADQSLLTYRYERPADRSGPGAGRPAKVYEPSDVEVEVSIPARRYDLVGTMLVDAIETEPPGVPLREHVLEVAAVAGRRLGEDVRRVRRLRPPGPERTLAVAEEVLAEHGFEPVRDGGELRLRNCPFRALASRAPDLVCGLNRAFIAGLVRGLGNETVDVALEPDPGRCCVVLRRPGGNSR